MGGATHPSLYATLTMLLNPNVAGAFCNAIAAMEHPKYPERTSLSTHLARQGLPALFGYQAVNIKYEEIYDKAQQEIHELLDEEDFFLSPKGFQIEVQDDWTSENVQKALLDFILPHKVEFLGGVRLRKTEPFKALTHAAQFTPTKITDQNQKVEIWVGNSCRPLASAWENEGTYFLNEMGQTRPLIKEEDLLREVVRLTKIHKYTEQFHKNREAYVREVLPGLLH